MATNTTTTRIKKTLTAIPASVQEAIGYLISIGKKQQAINDIKRGLKEETARLKEEADEKIRVLTLDRDNFFTALFAFASSRKRELTQTNRSVRTSSGVFGWRFTPPYVTLAPNLTDEALIKRLKAQGLDKYVRTIEEVNREALLEDRPVIRGVSYEQRDEFFAKPKLPKGNGRAEELVKEATEAVDV